MKLADLTWQEVKEYLKRNPSLLLPIGTCEQHSLHLPLNTDTLVAEKVAQDISDITGMLVAPTVNYGVNLPCDRTYSGTTTTTEQNLQELLRAILTWWKAQGFQQFYALSAHGDPLHLKAIREADPQYLTVVELYDMPLEDILEKQQFTRHADEPETSVMLYLFPEQVRTDQIVDFEISPDEFREYLYHIKTEPINDSPGCQGYPSFATSGKGKLIYERMKEKVLHVLQPR
jgi:creatinine amidohydrolase